tara:strand:- start:1937 stop:2125 length:189 start_codon:yes stop_codon:yes gene_type:complete
MLWAARNTPIGAHLLPETKEELRALAQKQSKSMSLVISEAISHWIEFNKLEQQPIRITKKEE